SPTVFYTLSLHDALPISRKRVSRATKKLRGLLGARGAIISESLLSSIFLVKFVQSAPSALANKVASIAVGHGASASSSGMIAHRSEEHTSELQSPDHLVC